MYGNKGYASFDRDTDYTDASAIDNLITSHSERRIFDDSECVTGEDKAYYSFYWKKASGLTIKQGIKNRRAMLEA